MSTTSVTRPWGRLLPLGVAFGLFVLATLPATPVLERASQVFAFNDGNIEVVMSPTYRYPGIFLGCWDNQFLFGQSGGSATLSLISVFETVLGPHGQRRWGVVLAAWLAGLAGAWACRQFGRSRAAAGLAGIFFTLCGWSFTFPTVGLPGRTFALAWALLSLGWIERARRANSWLGFAVAGGFLGLAVAETPDVGLIFALACGAYLALVALIPAQGPLRVGILAVRAGQAALYVAASLAVAYQMVTVQFGRNVSGAVQGGTEDPAARYEWATQWSLPPVETWSLFACDFHGAATPPRIPESPYWGGMGRSAGWEKTREGFRNFRLAGYAIGVVPLLLIAVLLGVLLSPAARPALGKGDVPRGWIFLGMAVVSLLLSWGHHFPFYRLFYALPYMDTIRNPDKWLGPFTLFAGLAAALGADAALKLATLPAPVRRRTALGVATLIAPAGVCAALTLLWLGASQASWVNSFRAVEYDEASARAAWTTAREASMLALAVTLAGVAALGVALFAPGKRGGGARVFIIAAMALMIFELGRAAFPYALPHDYSYLKPSNPMTRFFEENRTQGRIKLFPPQHPLLNNWRLTFLAAGGYDLFDPISIRTMPAHYSAFLDALNDQPRKVWMLGSLRYFLCIAPAAGELLAAPEFKGEFVERAAFGVTPTAGGQLMPTAGMPAEQQIIRILEFTPALPPARLVSQWQVFPDTAEGDAEALKRIADAAFDPARSLTVQGADALQPAADAPGSPGAVTVLRYEPRAARYRVESAAASLLVRSTAFDPNWRVTVDGRPAPLLRANHMFQAVPISAGAHEVAFEYRLPARGLATSVAGRVALLLAVLAASGLPGLRRAVSPAPTGS